MKDAMINRIGLSKDHLGAFEFSHSQACKSQIQNYKQKYDEDY
jgi:hypothetical protein